MLTFKALKPVINTLRITRKFALLSCAIFLAGILAACSEKPGTPSIPNDPSSNKPASSTPATELLSIEPPSSEGTLTVMSLEEKGARKLNSKEILALIVDHSIVFQHLGTGEYFEAIYKKDGHRLLTNVDSGSIEQETIEDEYAIRNDKLYTEFKGTPVVTTVYNLEDRYFAAVDSDNGIINYEIRDIAETTLSVQILKSQNAKTLSSDEIKQLFVGKTLLIKDLLTGDEFYGFYGDDGTRILRYASPNSESSEANDQIVRDPYRIEDGLLISMLDGNEIASTIFKLDAHYFGALSVDDGAVNFEFIPQ